MVVALGPRGMLQGFLESLVGIERLPDISGFPGAMLTLTFLSYPYILLTVRAALQRLDPSLEESSRSLGYSWRATFRRVVIPLLRPSVAAGGLLVALYTLSDFGAVSLLRYETFTWAIFIQYEAALDRTLGGGLFPGLGVPGLDPAGRRGYGLAAVPATTRVGPGRSAAGPGGSAGGVAVAGGRVLRVGGQLVPGLADVGAGLLGG